MKRIWEIPDQSDVGSAYRIGSTEEKVMRGCTMRPIVNPYIRS